MYSPARPPTSLVRGLVRDIHRALLLEMLAWVEAQVRPDDIHHHHSQHRHHAPADDLHRASPRGSW
jgi:hypothetical protein